jgi:ligand-binding sensor domain-containing protein
MKTRFFILIIFACGFFRQAASQHQLFRSYTVSDGLTNNAIRKIYQDSQGFIWICTWEGLSKFEGNKFTRFTTSNGLPHSMVNDVACW